MACMCKTKSGRSWEPEFIEKIDPLLCDACELCVMVCRRKVIEVDLVDDKVAAVPKNAENCIGDGNCAKICPNNAITLKKQI